jgi:hypothetical protein
MITIQRGPDAAFEQVEESLLVKTDGDTENDDERVIWVEYRFPGDDRIVHRSVQVIKKKWPAGMEVVMGIIGS